MKITERFDLGSGDEVLAQQIVAGTFGPQTDRACNTCGATVHDSQLGVHNDWHDGLSE